MITANQKDYVQYDEHNKVLYFEDVDTYEWAKSVFTIAKTSGFIGTRSMPELNFSFCDNRKYLVIKTSLANEQEMLKFFKGNLLKIIPISREISEETSLMTDQRQARTTHNNSLTFLWNHSFGFLRLLFFKNQSNSNNSILNPGYSRQNLNI